MREERAYRAEELGERRGRVVEADEDQAMHRLDAGGNKAGIGEVQAGGAEARLVGVDLGHVDQPAVEIVDPQVIEAGKVALVAGLLADDLRGAMATRVVEGFQLAVAVAADENRLAGETVTVT